MFYFNAKCCFCSKSLNPEKKHTQKVMRGYLVMGFLFLGEIIRISRKVNTLRSFCGTVKDVFKCLLLKKEKEKTKNTISHHPYVGPPVFFFEKKIVFSHSNKFSHKKSSFLHIP
jgi:hypothetical protein